MIMSKKQNEISSPLPDSDDEDSPGSPIRVTVNPERRSGVRMVRSDEYGGAHSAAPHLQEHRVKKQQAQGRHQFRSGLPYHSHNQRAPHSRSSRGKRENGRWAQRGGRGSRGRSSPHSSYRVNPYATPSSYVPPRTPRRVDFLKPIKGRGVWVPSTGPSFESERIKKKKKPGIVMGQPDGTLVDVLSLVPTSTRRDSDTRNSESIEEQADSDSGSDSEKREKREGIGVFDVGFESVGSGEDEDEFADGEMFTLFGVDFREWVVIDDDLI